MVEVLLVAEVEVEVWAVTARLQVGEPSLDEDH